MLAELVAAAPADTPVACFQNGVANERLVGNVFRNTYGVVVMMPAAHLEPGRGRGVRVTDPRTVRHRPGCGRE